MPADLAILGDQAQTRSTGLANDQAVERIPGPVQGLGSLNNFGKTLVQNFQPDFPFQIVQQLFRPDRQALDFAQKLQLEDDCRADDRLLLLDFS